MEFMLTGISKVPFQDALDLVRTRKVYLKAGYAYIPHQDIVTIVLNDFRTRLSKALAVSLLPDSQVASLSLGCVLSLPCLSLHTRLSPLQACFCCHPVVGEVNNYTG